MYIHANCDSLINDGWYMIKTAFRIWDLSRLRVYFLES